MKDLKHLWLNYIENPSSNDFPPDVTNITAFNFTNYILEDMSTFLIVYAASFPTVGSQEIIEKLFSTASNKLFSDTKPDDYVKRYGYYDKLIVDCVYQKPFLNHHPNVTEGCQEFQPLLTSNGLCHSFNGIDTAQIWYTSDMIQSFNTIFGTSNTQTKKFRGIDQSEGT